MPKFKPFRIFVVDDQEVIAATLATILNRSGHLTVFFTNPLKALAAVVESPPDCLISDIVMPELSGVDLAILMLKQCPDCRILLFSGQAESEDLLFDARRQGWTFELLCKPVHPTEILRRVQEHARKKPRSGVQGCETATPSPLKWESVYNQALHATA